MGFWESGLMSCQDLERIPSLKERGWNMWKINTLRSRYHIMPKPIVKRSIGRCKDAPWKMTSGGREVGYFFYMQEYLQKIDDIKESEKLTYKELKDHPEIKKELEKFKLLKETELTIDSRVKSIGFFANFESAKTNLNKVYKWGRDSVYMKFLCTISEDCKFLCREYYKINKNMRQNVLDNKSISEKSRSEKQKIGLKLDYIYMIMQAVIDQGKSLIDQKIITVQDWMAPIKKMEAKRG
jgi:hypothetical protein